MDPFSAILLIGLFTVATVNTAGTAVTDGIAQARGQTPPSQERWRAKEQRRQQRGEQPRDDPGGIRRIWQQHTEAAAEKSAAKHRGKIDYLREHADELAEGKRAQLERSARRREYLGGKAAAAGGASWQALKTAAQKASDAKSKHGERKLEKEAWQLNEHIKPSVQDTPTAASPDASDQEETPATVLNFTHRPRPDGITEVAVAPGDSSSGSAITGDPADPLTWHGVDAHGRDIQTGRGPSRTEILPDGGDVVVHDDDTYLDEESPERRLVADAQHAAEAAREHQERTAQQPANPADDKGVEMSGSTEITDLPTAHQRAQESSQYAGTVVSVLSDQLASLQAAASGMTAEAQMQESGSGSLAGEGFGSTITGKFDSGAEKYNNAVSALEQQIQAVQTAMEQVEAAQSEMNSAAAFFHEQQGLADSIGAQQQRGGVASRTDWYTGA